MTRIDESAALPDSPDDETLLRESAAPKGPATRSRVTLNPSAMRDQIPAMGLREYWYPLIIDKKVKKRPVGAKLLGTELAIFRGASGKVVALANDCPHRGEFLHTGTCEFQGTITCPYHGWTFDENGECVAVIGEGPESAIPGMRGARARVFPTETIKGIVFVWMGEKPPVDIAEDVPDYILDPDTLVQWSVNEWNCNWRPALENINDAHVYYVHRAALMLWTAPREHLMALRTMGGRRIRPEIVNGRAVVYSPLVQGDKAPQVEPGFQDVYPSLGGAKWPRHDHQYRWSQVMTKIKSRRPQGQGLIVQNREWQGTHLPSTFQVNGTHHVFTRIPVPIDEGHTRMFYFHTTRLTSKKRAIWDRIYFQGFHNWYHNHNFSRQDCRVVENQYYDRPEKLSATDVYAIATRRMVLDHARDFASTPDSEE